MRRDIKVAKSIILKELARYNVYPVKIILLNKNTLDKDYFDLVVVTDKKIDFNIKYDILDDIDILLIQENIHCVIHLVCRKEYEKDKNDVGYTLLYEAEKNGIEI